MVLTPADLEARDVDRLVIACDRCSRRGVSTVARLIEQHGRDFGLVRLRLGLATGRAAHRTGRSTPLWAPATRRYRACSWPRPTSGRAPATSPTHIGVAAQALGATDCRISSRQRSRPPGDQSSSRSRRSLASSSGTISAGSPSAVSTVQPAPEGRTRPATAWSRRGPAASR
jgi:hypothetical protein